MKNTKIPGTQSATLQIEDLENVRTFENKHFMVLPVKMNPETAHKVIVKNKLIEKTVILFNQNKAPFRIKIPHDIAEKYRIKQEIRQEIKQTEYKGHAPEDIMQLTSAVEEKIILMDYHNANKENWQEWMRIFAYESIYDVAFNRGIRHERQRRKAKESLSAFDVIGAEDVIELSHEMGISEDKLTSAVLEVISKRKNGGRA